MVSKEKKKVSEKAEKTEAQEIKADTHVKPEKKPLKTSTAVKKKHKKETEIQAETISENVEKKQPQAHPAGRCCWVWLRIALSIAREHPWLLFSVTRPPRPVGSVRISFARIRLLHYVARIHRKAFCAAPVCASCCAFVS